MLSALTVDELRAIIAHEMAHFSGRDTTYSSLFLPVYMGLGTSLELLGSNFDDQPGEDRGCAGCAFQLPMLLPVLVLKLYLFLFSLLDSSIRRVRERRADAIAAHVAGSQPFASGLKKAICAGTVFGEFMEKQFSKDPTVAASANYFAEFRSVMGESEARMEAIEQEAMAEKDDLTAHHPSLTTRLKSIPQVPWPTADERPARELLGDPEALEQELTRLLEDLRVQLRAAGAA